MNSRILMSSLALPALVALGCAQSLPNVETDATDDAGTMASSGDSTGGNVGESTATGAADASTAATGADLESTGIDTVCGNGIIEVGETCDDEGESEACDADCTDVVCGDQIINATAGELCDHELLAGATCRDFGFDGGELSCSMDCFFDTSSCGDLPSMPVLILSVSAIKWFDFSWAAAAGSEYYQLLESPTPGDPLSQVGGDIVGESISISTPLHLRAGASYILRACNVIGCTDSDPASAAGSLAEAVGYFKASNVDLSDNFGDIVALGGDGNTLAVGAFGEDSVAAGVDGDQTDDSLGNSGAVYVFVRDTMGQWSQQAYIKVSNPDALDEFGSTVSLSGNGDTLVVGAPGESSNATGVDGNQANDSAVYAGAVYVFVRDGMGQWLQQAYIKASNAEAQDHFGEVVALSSDGNTFVVGVRDEDSNATGIDGDPLNNSAVGSGAVYVFMRDGMDVWSQQAYIKASNAEAGDSFGSSAALSDDGSTLAVGATYEDSATLGIDGDQLDNFAMSAGAVYVFVRDGMNQWSQQAYVKASNASPSDLFGNSVALSGNGDGLAVGAYYEDSGVAGIDGNQLDNSTNGAGAVYVLVRDGMGQWSQQAYVKASNPDNTDQFGWSVALSDDGDILAVGALQEDSMAIGVDGDQTDDSASESGAVYVFVRDAMEQWSQRSYVKAPNPDADDRFGRAVTLSGDGNSLAVGAYREDSGATGVGGDPLDGSVSNSGAVYLF